MNFYLTLHEINQGGVSTSPAYFPKSGKECNLVTIPEGVVENFREDWKNIPSVGDVIHEVLGRIYQLDGAAGWLRLNKKMKRVVAMKTETDYLYYIPTSFDYEELEEDKDEALGGMFD